MELKVGDEVAGVSDSGDYVCWISFVTKIDGGKYCIDAFENREFYTSLIDVPSTKQNGHVKVVMATDEIKQIVADKKEMDDLQKELYYLFTRAGRCTYYLTLPELRRFKSLCNRLIDINRIKQLSDNYLERLGIKESSHG